MKKLVLTTILSIFVSIFAISSAQAQSEWVDIGAYLIPAEISDGVLVGGNTAGGSSHIQLNSDGSAVFNEQGNASDFRIEGYTNPYLFFVDASTDSVGIGAGSISPQYTLDVGGDLGVNGSLNFEGTTTDSNEIILTAEDPMVDTHITLPAKAGTIRVTSDIFIPSSGLAFDNGAMLMEGIVDAQSASQSQPIAIRLDSGVYDISSQTLLIPDHVTLIGSGEDATSIMFSSSVGVEMGNRSEIRNLMITSGTVNYFSIAAIDVPTGKTSTIDNITVKFPPSTNDVTALTNRGTVLIENSKFNIIKNNGALSASIVNVSGFMEVRDSSLTAGSNKNLITKFGGAIAINNSKLFGDTLNAQTNAIIVNSYDHRYVAVP
jgi:hypothetical protein